MRSCIKIKENENRIIYLDEDNSKKIIEILKSDKKIEDKFWLRIEQISRSLTNKETYEKLSGFDSLWEIRMFKSSPGRNHRIYCKQIESDDRIIHVIIVTFFLQKKSKGIPKKILNKLREIDKYEYEIE